MTDPPFDRLQADIQGAGVDAGLECLADWLGQAEKRLPRTFRHAADASPAAAWFADRFLTTPLEDLDEPLRGEVESAYLAACREAGWLLWNEGEFRQAWMYLRRWAIRRLSQQLWRRSEPTETIATS